ncbi:MAG: alpha-L-fucosidase [Victivallaceae bacterium]|nr:alpha-L-fucosidase [Victivallaceae bacterium]
MAEQLIPLPRIAAFENLGLGLFVHWGLYSQFGVGEWTQKIHKRPVAEYEKIAATFTAADFDAEDLARTAKNAGMNYIVLTTRHHEGFSLYDCCGLNDFDAVHSPAKRDLVAEFVAGCRKYGIRPFFYHTMIDWHWEGQETVNLSEKDFGRYLDYLCASVEILCKNYGEIGGFWFDGTWSRPKSDWQLGRLYGLIRKYQPETIIVNNTGLEHLGEYGHPEVDSVTFENNSAKPMNRTGCTKYIAAEVCKTMNYHWGRSENDFAFLSPRDVIEKAAHSRGCGANFLLNIGPEAQGRIPDYERSVLAILGKWVALYREAIYEPRPVTGVKCPGRDFILQAGKTYYYFAFDLDRQGDSNVMQSAHASALRGVCNFFTGKVKSACWLDDQSAVEIVQNPDAGVLSFYTPGFTYGSNTVVRVLKIETK